MRIHEKRWSLTVCGLLGALAMPPAQAEEQGLRDQLLGCAAQRDYTARLACYDSLAHDQQVLRAAGETAAGQQAVAARAHQPPAVTSQVAGWTVTRQGEQVTLSVAGKPVSLAGTGLATLMLHCTPGTPATLAIQWGGSLGGDVFLSLGTDQGYRERVAARMNAPADTTGYPRPVAPLLGNLQAASYLDVFADGGQQVWRTRFPLSSLATVLAPYRQICGL